MAIYKVVAIFGLAAFLSAWVFVSYSAWVDSLYTANYRASPYGSENFSRNALTLANYGNTKWPIFCLGFPLAMTLAFFAAKTAGLLPHIGIRVALVGCLPVYIAPGMILFLSAVSWYVLAIPSLVAAAYLLTVSVHFITSDNSTRFFRRFLLSGAACGAAGLVTLFFTSKIVGDTAWRVFFISLQVVWGGLFGMGLAASKSTGA